MSTTLHCPENPEPFAPHPLANAVGSYILSFALATETAFSANHNGASKETLATGVCAAVSLSVARYFQKEAAN
jgi:hypothetical protein